MQASLSWKKRLAAISGFSVNEQRRRRCNLPRLFQDFDRKKLWGWGCGWVMSELETRPASASGKAVGGVLLVGGEGEDWAQAQ